MVQITAVSLDPVTVAVNCCVPLGARLTDDGLIVTEIAANACRGARKSPAARRNHFNRKRGRTFLGRKNIRRVNAAKAGLMRASQVVASGAMWQRRTLARGKSGRIRWLEALASAGD